MGRPSRTATPTRNGSEDGSRKERKDSRFTIFLKKVGIKKEDEYKLVADAPIGRGAFGEVFLVRDREGNLRALKKIRVANKDEKQAAMCEAQLLHDLDHPNLLKVFHFYEHSSWIPFSDKVIGMVAEYCDQGCLSKALGKHVIEEEDVILVMAQVASALAYLHSKGIMHRDIKLENILVKTNSEDHSGRVAMQTLKLADLGLATLLEDEGGKYRQTHTIAGTQSYMAPEVLTNKSYSFPADIFSLGVVLAELIIWRRSWKVMDLRENVRESTRVSRDLKELCLRMLAVNPTSRPSVHEVVDNLAALMDRRPAVSLIPKVLKERDFTKYLYMAGFCAVLAVLFSLMYTIKSLF